MMKKQDCETLKELEVIRPELCRSFETDRSLQRYLVATFATVASNYNHMNTFMQPFYPKMRGPV